MESSREVLSHIITGDIARELSTAKETQHMAEGNLFPHEDLIRAKTAEMVEKRRKHGAEIVFLDGCPRFDDQVKWLLEQQFIGAETGCLVKIESDVYESIERAKQRNRDEQDKTEFLLKKIEKHSQMIAQMERLISYYAIPYYTIPNTDLFQATKTLAKYVGLRK